MGTTNVVIDISHHNGRVDLQRAAADGILGVIHKATQGSGFADAMYAKNRRAAASADLLWGAYHFGTGADPTAQAKQFLRVADLDSNNLLVLDFEENTQGPTMTLVQARAFIKTVQEATGRICGLYGGSTLKEALAGKSDPLLAACWLWWAQYSSTPSIPSNLPDFTLWQYTDGHHGDGPFEVDGVGPCDRDKYQGSVDDLRTKWAQGSLA